MNQDRLGSMQYYLFPSLDPGTRWMKEHDQAFEFWSDTWRKILNGLNFSANNLEEEWGRQDRIACLFDNDKPVAAHLYSFFSLKSKAALSHPYFKNYTPEFFKKLDAMGVESVMSMEYMTIHPEWRKHSSGFHLGAVLGGLALKVMEHHGLEAAIAPARRDHRVHDLAYIYGGECLVENVVNHNVPCDLVACRQTKVHDHPEALVRQHVQSLWRQRIVAISEANIEISRAA